jgi:hypothetical protein
MGKMSWRNDNGEEGLISTNLWPTASTISRYFQKYNFLTVAICYKPPTGINKYEAISIGEMHLTLI